MMKIVISSMGICHPRSLNINFLSRVKDINRIQERYLKIDEDLLDEELAKNNIEYDIIRRIDKISKLVLASTISCNKSISAKINLDDYINDIGVVYNTNFGALHSSEVFINNVLENGVKKASPLIFPFSVPNAATGISTIHLGVRGLNTTLSGYNPIGYVYDLIKLEKIKGCFTGGFDQCAEQFRTIIIEDNLFYSNSISDGSASIFICDDSFANRNELDKLMEIEKYSIKCNYSRLFSIDNTIDLDIETIDDCIKEILADDEAQDNIKCVISSFMPGHCFADIEKQALKKYFNIEELAFVYPKLKIGETFGASSTFNVIFAYYIFSELNLTEHERIMVCNYDIGGNYSSMILKKIDKNE